MNNYKATSEQWEKVKEWSSEQSSTDACLLELRARMEALEAQANHFVDVSKMVPPSVATDEELSDTWHKGSLTPDGRYIIGRKGWRAVYNLGVAHGKAGSQEVAEPAPVAGGLVERISYEIRIGRTTLKSDEVTAVHTILEVARWLRSELVSREIAERLEQEAGR